MQSARIYIEYAVSLSLFEIKEVIATEVGIEYFSSVMKTNGIGICIISINEYNLIRLCNCNIMNYTCPMCGYIGSFKPYGKTIRDNAMCPRCMSLERHRARALLLKDMIKSEMDTIRTLYVSPERSFKKFLSGIDSIDLTCIDIDPNNPEIDYVSDITRTQFEDGEFDIIICCDVLSEVRNDMSAIIEMSRIISPRGKILLDHPKREKTKRIKTLTLQRGV